MIWFWWCWQSSLPNFVCAEHWHYSKKVKVIATVSHGKHYQCIFNCYLSLTGSDFVNAIVRLPELFTLIEKFKLTVLLHKNIFIVLLILHNKLFTLSCVKAVYFYTLTFLLTLARQIVRQSEKNFCIHDTIAMHCPTVGTY